MSTVSCGLFTSNVSALLDALGSLDVRRHLLPHVGLAMTCLSQDDLQAAPIADHPAANMRLTTGNRTLPIIEPRDDHPRFRHCLRGVILRSVAREARAYDSWQAVGDGSFAFARAPSTSYYHVAGFQRSFESVYRSLTVWCSIGAGYKYLMPRECAQDAWRLACSFRITGVLITRTLISFAVKATYLSHGSSVLLWHYRAISKLGFAI